MKKPIAYNIKINASDKRPKKADMAGGGEGQGRRGGGGMGGMGGGRSGGGGGGKMGGGGMGGGRGGQRSPEGGGSESKPSDFWIRFKLATS